MTVSEYLERLHVQAYADANGDLEMVERLVAQRIQDAAFPALAVDLSRRTRQPVEEHNDITSDRAQALATQIRQAKSTYYHADPVMSDAQFDAKEAELKRLDPNHPALREIGAPIREGGAWQKLRHRAPMTSLNKATNIIELTAWYEGLRLSPGSVLWLTEKLDGISISLYYLNGQLQSAATRGEGDAGENITRNVVLMQGVRQELSFFGKPFSGHLRGEVICKRSLHAQHFPDASNPRNTASGTAQRQSDAAKCQYLTVMFYQVLPDVGPLPTKEEEHAALQDAGLFTSAAYPCETVADVEALYTRYIDETRKSLDHEIDGLVIELNDNAVALSLGMEGGNPAAGIALKFPHESGATTARALDVQTAPTGIVSLMAIFDPIQLVRATVQRANLATVALMLELGIGPGAIIEVSRRKDVIPKVERTLTPGASVFAVPTHCPSCGYDLVMEGAYLKCLNLGVCPAQVVGSIDQWCKKIGILDWGDAAIEALVTSGRVRDIADLYTLQLDDLSTVEVGGRKLGTGAKTMLRNLHDKRTLPLHAVVGSLGIPGMGRSMCRLLVDAGVDTLEAMQAATALSLSDIPRMGKIKAPTFVRGLAARADLLAKLLRNGITISPPAQGVLKGISVCMTGFREPDMALMIERAGGSMKDGVSKGLGLLVAAEPNSTSGKAKKARDLGIRIVSVAEMWGILNSGMNKTSA